MKRTTRYGVRSLAGRRRRLGAAATLVSAACLALGALVGCGGSDTNGVESAPASDLGDSVVEALRGASSAHVVGVVESAGREGSSYDLQLTGQAAMGKIVRDGHAQQIVRIGEDTYVRGDADYWKSVGENDAADLLAGSWVLLSPDGSKNYSAYSIDGIALAVAQYTEPLADPVTQSEREGQAVVTASAPDGSTLWASNTGSAYPLRLEMSGTDTGFIEFSDYDAELTIAPPPDPIDLAKLG